MHTISKALAAVLVASSLIAAPVAQANDAAVGALIGGGTGAVVGKTVAGRDGAVVGGIIGAVAGVAIATQDRDDHRRPRHTVRHKRHHDKVEYKKAPHDSHRDPHGY